MLTWEDRFNEGVKCAKTQPWASLSGKSDAFRQGFYSVTSERLKSNYYTLTVKYEAFNGKAWLKKSFNTCKKELSDFLKQSDKIRNVKVGIKL